MHRSVVPKYQADSKAKQHAVPRTEQGKVAKDDFLEL
jgi:hypothetical protein